MIISTKKGTPQEELQKIISGFEAQGLEVTLIRGTDYNVFGLVGDTTKINDKVVAANPWVESVTRVSAPYKKANRLFHAADTIVDVAGVKVGGKENVVVIGGPCSVECEQQAVDIAKAVKAAGGKMLRGGAYKPRTSPYAFQGLGTEGILDLVKAREETGLPVILISDGRLLSRNLKGRGYEEIWLQKQLASHGVERPEQVFLLTVDEGGNTYCVPKEAAR